MNLLTIQTPKGTRIIGPGHPVFIVTELSCNHHQRYEEAVALIDAATQAGADAVKLQTYTADTITIDSDKEWFQIKVNDAWKGQTLYSLYQQAYTPWEWQPKLQAYGESKGLVVFSSPFDETAVDFLETMNAPLYKVASFEIVDIPLLKKIAATKKPVILSRGLAAEEEIAEAVNTLRQGGCVSIAVLHCISAYPAALEDMNLRTIPDIMKRFDVVSGLSDHNLNPAVDIAAVAVGASIIEKHIILKRSDGGFDAAYSLEPNELKELVDTIRHTEKALGKVTYELGVKEKENRQFRPSLFAVQDIELGESFTPDNVRSIRPSHGLPPKWLERVIGKKASRNIERGTPLSLDLIEAHEKDV